MKKAVIYARYSSVSQDEQTIEMQIKKCREFAEKNDLLIVDEYTDEAKTGRNGKRNGLQKLLADSKTGKFQHVIMYMSDRYYRNALEALSFEYELNKNGVSLLFTMESYDDSPFGRFSKLINYANNQLYSDIYSVKISDGLASNAKESLTTGNNVPYGFKTNKETKKFELDPTTAPIAEEIFERYAKGETVADITSDLNKRGYKTVKGNAWNKNSLHRMLSNKKYIGIYTYKGEVMPKRIPRIISDELFYKVQEIIKKNKKAPARQKAFKEYLLTQKLFCGYCGEMMTGYSAKKKYNYYGCKGKKAHKCEKKPIYKDLLEDLVVNETKSFLNNQNNVDMIIKEVELLAKKERDDTELKKLKKQLNSEQKRKDNLLDALSNCSDSNIRQDIYKKMSEINNNVERIEFEISKIETPFDNLLLDKIKFFIQEMKNGNINDLKLKKTLINLFINKVYLYEDKVVIVFLTTKKKSVELSKDLLEQTKSLFNTTLVEQRRIELLSKILYYTTSTSLVRFVISLRRRL